MMRHSPGRAAHFRLFILALFVGFVSVFTENVRAQDTPFAEEIRQFAIADSAHFPPRNAILFVGSSSFRLWHDVDKYFPGYTIINRGFGGSTLEDVIRYAGQIIFPYHPRQIVIYCGENDMATADPATPQMVFNRFKSLFGMIRQKIPGVPIVYVSMKPSPSRQLLLPAFREGNRLIMEFLKSEPATQFIDVYSLMLNSKGQPREELFAEDRLHMNPGGYKIWQKALQPVLIKEK